MHLMQSLEAFTIKLMDLLIHLIIIYSAPVLNIMFKR